MNTESYADMDFSKICRVCCLEGNMMSVFKVHLSKKLMQLTQIQVWPNDGLPAQICSKCISILYISFQFKKQCEKSDVKLRHILQQSQLKQKEEQQQENKFNCQSSFVCCPDQKSETILDVQQYDQMQNVHPPTAEQMQNHQTQLVYNNGITFDLQSLQLPSNVSYPTYTVEQANVITFTSLSSSSSVSTPYDSDKSGAQNNSEPAQKSLEASKSCPTCGKEFATIPKLTRHIKTHASILPYKCEVCQKGFSHSGNFKVHMRMHNNERPFACNLCDKACRQQQDLEKHMRTHTGCKPHVCKICQKAFSISSNLIAHTRTHSKEKPYVCLICQKAFCQSNELKKHNRIHNSVTNLRKFNLGNTSSITESLQRPYICSLCNKSFAQSSSLQAHIRKHASTGNFSCLSCSNYFKSDEELKKHCHLRHNKESSDKIPDIQTFELRSGHLVIA